MYIFISSLCGTIKLLIRKKPALNIGTKPSIFCNQVLSLNMARTKKCKSPPYKPLCFVKKQQKSAKLNKIFSQVSRHFGFHSIYK